MSCSIASNKPPEDRRIGAVPAVRTVVNPFALSCRFDCARGEFTLRAGARAGAAVVATFLILGMGSLAFIRTFFKEAPVIVAVDPPPAPATPTQVAKAELDMPTVTSTPAALIAKELPSRTPGLNYVVLKSFPGKREAEAARDALNAKGVAASVEHNLPGWSKKSNYTVVGLTGFDLKREQDVFDRHVKDLKALHLAPKPYKWRGTEVANASR